MEQTKAKIEFIKTLFLVFVAALFSIIGYLFANIDGVYNTIKFFGLAYAIIFLIVLNSILIVKWIEEIKKMKDEK